MSNTDIFPDQTNRGRLREKWEFVIDPGFAAVPYVLLLHQRDLGLTSENLNVLLNILAHWHANGRIAFPHSSTIAKRIGISQRSVQRSLSWLVKNEFITKAERVPGASPQGYDPKPLVEKLKPYAWARIQLMQERRRDDVLSDELIVELSRSRKTTQELFGDAIKQIVENGGGYPAPPAPVKNG
jgi:hypothetical protein